MTVLRTVEEVRAWRARHPRVGFVPTMGALHKGHLELMRRSVSQGLPTVVSIFVNPLQFAAHEDLSRYPRQESADIELCASVGVEAVYLGQATELTQDNWTTISVAHVTEGGEGEMRPTHFAGVATIVAKLFGIVQPTVAVFGWKDLQQCAVIRRMVNDLHLPLRLDFVETVRESDGLAMSSRNAYFSPEQRTAAVHFPRELHRTALSVLEGEFELTNQDKMVRELEARLGSKGIHLDYVMVVNPWTMKPVESLTSDSRIVSAVKLGPVRLLDNFPIERDFLSRLGLQLHSGLV